MIIIFPVSKIIVALIITRTNNVPTSSNITNRNGSSESLTSFRSPLPWLYQSFCPEVRNEPQLIRIQGESAELPVPELRPSLSFLENQKTTLPLSSFKMLHCTRMPFDIIDDGNKFGTYRYTCAFLGRIQERFQFQKG